MNRFSTLLTGATLCAGMCTASVALANPTDTIQMRLSDGATMTLYVRNEAELRKLRTYKMDSLMALLDRYVTQAQAMSKNAGTAGRTTMEFNPQRDLNNPNAPEKLKIVVYGDQERFSATDGSNPKPTVVRIGKDDGKGVMVRVEEGPGRESTQVRVGKGVQVRVQEGKGGDKTYVRLGNTEFNNDSSDIIDHEPENIRYDERRTHDDIQLGFGLNNIINGSRAEVAGQPGQTLPIDLRPWGSRFVQLGWVWDTRIGKAVTSAPFIRYGFNFAFNNYMLDKNRMWVDDNDVTRLANAPEGRELQKSKLATTVLNLPVLLGIKLRNSHGNQVFRLAAGGFVGYRLNSRTKLKYRENGSTHKPKDHGSYNLEDMQYGATGAVSIYGHELFVNYNLNELFKKDRGPQGNVLAVGYTLCGIDGSFRSQKYRNR